VKPRKLNAIIMYNGGIPVTPLERIILPAAREELDPIAKTLTAPKKQKNVLDLFSSASFPTGWNLRKRKPGAPQLHFQYNGSALNGTPYTNTIQDVFVCVVAGTTKNPDPQRVLYIRDLPLSGEDPLDFDKDPYNRETAWLTLYIWGKDTVNSFWKASHQVNAYFTLEGEVKGTELARP